ncbi:MAG TPA: exodeoxyribonuclease VII small subunit [Actinobacteria bacterium]|nr:exodeoxyribonuclease VII small subunit [Actinomycetota bacterium]
MSDPSFDEALSRLEEIVEEVKKKDVPLDKSLDLLEEGVKLANVCTEKTDQSHWRDHIEETD